MLLEAYFHKKPALARTKSKSRHSQPVKLPRYQKGGLGTPSATPESSILKETEKGKGYV